MSFWNWKKKIAKDVWLNLLCFCLPLILHSFLFCVMTSRAFFVYVWLSWSAHIFFNINRNTIWSDPSRYDRFNISVYNTHTDTHKMWKNHILARSRLAACVSLSSRKQVTNLIRNFSVVSFLTSQSFSFALSLSLCVLAFVSVDLLQHFSRFIRVYLAMTFISFQFHALNNRTLYIDFYDV